MKRFLSQHTHNNHPHNNHPSGFTLVELAVVVVVIGILLAGALKGGEMIKQRRVLETIEQVKIFETATDFFKTKYRSLPGDLRRASRRLEKCRVVADCEAPLATAGNGYVGALTWNMVTPQVTAATTSTEAAETIFFWRHLAAADLLSGVSTRNVAPAFGITNPRAPIGGGWLVGNAQPSQAPVNNTSTVRLNDDPLKPALILALVASPTAPVGGAAGSAHPLLPADAAMIDRKIDDGFSGNGTVQAGGVILSCFADSFPNTTYNELVSRRDCSLYFRIRG
jgi:prepilin-type N-terminal cleavage/methylation domain-containing protein